MSIIEARQLTKSFGDLTAVSGISFSVAQGEIYGLVGPDGAGKTTTMRMLAAILEPTSGDAWVGGFHVTGESEKVKEKIGYVSQRFGLYPDLTVTENLQFYADIYSVPRSERSTKIKDLLSFSGLGPFKRRQAAQLSGGMKQKLGLACALVHAPVVLFLDEPTNGVDPVSRRDFWRILHQLLLDGVTIFISTSYLDEAERCNRVALMHDGRLLAVGTPGEVKTMVPHRIIELQVDKPRDALKALRAVVGKSDVNLQGDRLHLVGGEVKVDARRVLEAAAIQVQNIRDVEPSLEDVFAAVLSGDGHE